MSAAAVVSIAVPVILLGAGYVGYRYGRVIESSLTRVYVDAYTYYANAHHQVSDKLAAIKAEVEKIEAEAKAEEKAVVARLKALL